MTRFTKVFTIGLAATPFAMLAGSWLLNEWVGGSSKIVAYNAVVWKEEPIVGPWQPDYTRVLTTSISDRLTERVQKYALDHGQMPSVAEFWRDIDVAPLHNPLDGSAVVTSSDDAESLTSAGWVYDREGGEVHSAIELRQSRAARLAATRPLPATGPIEPWPSIGPKIRSRESFEHEENGQIEGGAGRR